MKRIGTGTGVNQINWLCFDLYALAAHFTHSLTQPMCWSLVLLLLLLRRYRRRRKRKLFVNCRVVSIWLSSYILCVRMGKLERGVEWDRARRDCIVEIHSIPPCNWMLMWGDCVFVYAYMLPYQFHRISPVFYSLASKLISLNSFTTPSRWIVQWLWLGPVLNPFHHRNRKIRRSFVSIRVESVVMVALFFCVLIDRPASWIFSNPFSIPNNWTPFHFLYTSIYLFITEKQINISWHCRTGCTALKWVNENDKYDSITIRIESMV